MCNGSRVLTPAETDAIRVVIAKPSNRHLYDLMAYSGLRLAEVQQLVDSPDVVDLDRRVITIRSGKARASQVTRNVQLCDKGLVAVEHYLDRPRVPSSPSVWCQNLIRWARAARLAPIPGRDASTYNPCGVTVRTSRKTLESWLLATYPERATQIALSQGHTELTAIRHYLNLSFTSDERLAIADQVAGWLR